MPNFKFDTGFAWRNLPSGHINCRCVGAEHDGETGRTKFEVEGGTRQRFTVYGTNTGREQCDEPSWSELADAVQRKNVSEAFTYPLPKADLLKPGTFALHKVKGKGRRKRVEILEDHGYGAYGVRRTDLRKDGTLYNPFRALARSLTPLCPVNPPPGTLVRPMWERATLGLHRRQFAGTVCETIMPAREIPEMSDSVVLKETGGYWPTRLLELVRLGPAPSGQQPQNDDEIRAGDEVTLVACPKLCNACDPSSISFKDSKTHKVLGLNYKTECAGEIKCALLSVDDDSEDCWPIAGLRKVR